MLISMNWIQDFVDLDGLDLEALIRRFTLSTAEVEEIIYKGKDVCGVVTARIEHVEKHPDSKKLHLLRVNTGESVVDCVCGAPNVREGMVVAFAKAGGRVQGMEIQATTNRGLSIVRHVLFRSGAWGSAPTIPACLNWMRTLFWALPFRTSSRLKTSFLRWTTNPSPTVPTCGATMVLRVSFQP